MKEEVDVEQESLGGEDDDDNEATSVLSNNLSYEGAGV